MIERLSVTLSRVDWSILNIEFLNLQLAITAEKEIHAKYSFQVKTFDVVEGQVSIGKKKKDFAQKILPAQYELYANSGTLDNDKVQKLIAEIIDPVKTKVLF